MKKLLSIVLALALMAGMGLTAMAAPQAEIAPYDATTAPLESNGSDARLAAVTLKVKNRLGLDTEGYEEFSGNLNENALAPSWNLYWSGAAGSLNITATEDGDILSLYRNEYDYYRDPFAGTYGPMYPVDESASALRAAEAFVAQVLDPALESVDLAPSRAVTPYAIMRTPYNDSTNYYYSSIVYLNGRPSPLSMSISVRADGTVVSFNRDSLSGRYLGTVPSAAPVSSEADARALLRGTLALKLEYVLGDDGKTAVLRYLPVSGDEYYVDAATGKLINRSELLRNVTEIYDGGNGEFLAKNAADPEAAAADMAGGARLNQSELDGVAKLEGILSKEEIDAALKASLPELGLADYILSGASYSVAHAKEEDAVTCTLTYSKKHGDGIIRRTVAADGRTAALQSVYTSYPWQQESAAPTVSFAAAEDSAEAFLQKHYAARFDGSEQTDTRDAAAYQYGITEHSFTYSRKVNGYFYRANTITVGIDPLDGTLAAFRLDWDADLVFDSPDGIVAESAAIDAYLAAYAAPVRYIAVPQALDGAAPEYGILREQGYGYFSTLALGYQLSLEDGWFEGVDAKTGEALVKDYTDTVEALAYDDLGTSWAKAAIERLAQYRIGFAGGKFRPAESLTQLDLIALLVSTDGYLIDPDSADAANQAYNAAHSMGILRKTERSDDKVLTRMEMTKLILDASGYGRVARLDGIFTCNFSDADQIPASLYGYAAVAQGLGILRGNSAGQCMPNAPATHAEAAAMLDQFMSRTN